MKALTLPLAAGLALWSGAALAAGPTPGRGPWVACPNESPVCTAQLGPDLDPADDDFDCLTRNGRPGHALQSSTTGTARCWAN
jgi:hypothetical protein